MKRSLKKQLLSTILGLGMLGAIAPNSLAQVKGISYTLSPTGEYVFWDKNTGISNGFLVGGHLGFGFGEFVELRATYLQDVNNLTRDFSALSPMALKNAKLDTVGVSVQRWGGDLKLNLSRGGLVPYLTIGTGVQTLGADTLAKSKSIYVSGGAGLQFSGGDRYTLNVQAVNTAFNGSPVRSLTSAAERTANNLTNEDYPNDLLYNWSVRASLILYLGGRRPGQLTDVDKAYLNNFSGGVALPIEVTAGQLNFGKGLPYANTRYAGVATGLNFGPYVGIRGFYWRGLEDGYFNSSFSKLALYGGEGKFKLNSGQGLTPSILLGGGVIDAMKGYQADSINAEPLDKKGFVSGGIGLDLPFGRAVKLTAYAKALLTAPDSILNAADPAKLATSWAYGLSLNLLIGNGMKDVDSEKEESYDELVMNNLKREKNRADNLKDDYEKRVDRLDDLIKDARNDGDRQTQYDLQDEQERLERGVKEIEKLQDKEEEANKDANKKGDALLIDMKPTDYRSKLDDIEKQYGRGTSSGSRSFFNDRNDRRDNDRRNNSDRNDDDKDRDIRVLEDRLKSIEQKLDDMQQNNQRGRQNQMNYDNRANGNYGDDYNNNNRDGRNDDYRNDDRRNSDDRNRNQRYDDRNNQNNNRNNRYDDRNYRNEDSRSRRNYDNRDEQNRNNRNDDRYEQNENYGTGNANYDDRNRDMRGNAGGRNGAYQPDTNNKMQTLKEERRKGENLRKAYESRIDKLDDQIKDAKDKGDDQLEMDLQGEKESLEDGVKDIRNAMDKEDRANRRAYRDNDPSQLRMESNEFRSMMDDVNKKNEKYKQNIDRSLEDFEKKGKREINDLRDDRDSYRQDMQREMDDLKQQIRDMRSGRSERNNSGSMRESGNSRNADKDTRNDDRQNLNDRNARRSSDDDDNRNNSSRSSDDKNRNADNRNSDDSDRNATRAASMMTSNSYLTERQLDYQSENKAKGGFFSLLNYDGSSAVGGINIGGAATINLGFRNYFRYKESNFFLMPEAFFGFGASSSYGLFANGIYDFKFKNTDNFSPYAGAGVGIMKIGSRDANNTKLAFNIIVGANLFQVAGGRFFVDYSIRNFFKYNQLSAGYRLPF